MNAEALFWLAVGMIAGGLLVAVTAAAYARAAWRRACVNVDGSGPLGMWPEPGQSRDRGE